MKTKKYRHISKAERQEIALLKDKNYSLRDISKALERSVSSIAEEISKNSVRGVYNPKKADLKVRVRRKYSKYQGMKVVQDSALRNFAEEGLEQGWSPDEMSGRLKNVRTDIKYASRMAFYKFVYSPYGRQLEKYLRRKRRKKKGVSRAKVNQLKNRTFIEERPEIVSKRQRYGDWEGDLIVSNKSGKGVLIVLYERKSMYTLIKKSMSRSPNLVNQYIREMTGGFICFSSLTLDNDISFKKHEELSELLNAPVFFCHSYHAWEKGGVENTNGLIRQYIPKGADISMYSDEYIKEIETKLNNRPRKKLNYRTPLEVMLENNQFKNLCNSDIIIKQKTPIAGVRVEG